MLRRSIKTPRGQGGLAFAAELGCEGVGMVPPK